MVTKEYWWAGEESKALKNLRWARPTSGQRADIMSWLRTQEAALERSSIAGSTSRDVEAGTRNDDADDEIFDKAHDPDRASRLTGRSA
jgi:hypothetical protein